MNDDSVLYEKNSNEKVQIASLTKIMTSIVAIENIDNIVNYGEIDKDLYDDIVNTMYNDSITGNINTKSDYESLNDKIENANIETVNDKVEDYKKLLISYYEGKDEKSNESMLKLFLRQHFDFYLMI